jgi:hypothetical protein
MPGKTFAEIPTENPAIDFSNTRWNMGSILGNNSMIIMIFFWGILGRGCAVAAGLYFELNAKLNGDLDHIRIQFNNLAEAVV